jgi:hypothetical protein
MAFINLFRNFFKAPKTGLIFIIVSIFYRIINILVVSETDRDTLILAVQSKNLLDGNGLSIPKYYSAAIDSPVFDLTPNWPPGYPILLAPVLKIFNYDIYWATTAIDLIACIFFIFLVRRIAFDLKFPLAAVNILTLVSGCFSYEFIIQSLPTDTSSFVIFLFGLRLLLYNSQKDNFATSKLLLAALLLFIPCTFRYSYPPLSIAAFVAVIFTGLYLKKNILVKKGLLGLSVLFVLLIAFFLLLKNSTGNSGYIVETGRGFFPEQLLKWAPIGPGAFIDPVLLTSQLIHITGISVNQSLLLLEIANAIMITGVMLVFIYLFFWKRFFKSLEPFRWFMLAGFFISAATCISLGYLTLTYKPQPGWGNYLGEPRYFMFVTLYLQIIFIGWIFLFASWRRNIFQKVIVFIISFVLFIEVAHSIYFDTKFILHFEKNKSASFQDPDYVYFGKMCKQLVKENPDSEILVASDSDEFFRLMASYLGQKGVYDGFSLIKSLPKIKKKTILILALYDNEITTYQAFLSLQNAN